MKSLKKTIVTGLTTASILGTAISPFAATQASAASNNQYYKSSNYTHNYEYNHFDKYNYYNKYNHYTHLNRYNQVQINEYKMRFVQLGYNIYDRNSIIKFQKRYHLYADGILGQATIAKLIAITYSQSDVDLLARTIYIQNHNQPFNSQIGVGAVILNRVHHNQFPNTIKEVIRRDDQFNHVMYRTNVKPDARAYQAAYYAIQGNDPTRNALYIYKENSMKSTSSVSLTKPVVIGQTVFSR